MPSITLRGPCLVLVGLALSSCGDAPAPAWAGYGEGEYIYVSAPVAGRLATLSVVPGQDLARGAPLFALDHDAEQAARAADAARVAQAQAQVANAAKGRRTDEIAVVQAQLAQARAQAELAAADLARQQQLVAQGFITPARLDDAKTALAQAQARVAELGASLQVARLPSRSDEQQAARAAADAAAQALRAQAWRVQQMQQQSPADARVADTYFRVGEWVNAGVPVVSLLPDGATKARFFVPEAERGTIVAGQAVTLSCDGCGAPIPARITRIATQPEYTPPVIFSNAQRAKLVFMVEARPDAADGKRLKPGQPLDVRRAAAAAGRSG
jgi:HlyD family secretion protein